MNTFVCLQAEFSLHTPESAWRSGQGLRPYIKDAQRLLIRVREDRSPRITQVCARWSRLQGLWGAGAGCWLCCSSGDTGAAGASWCASSAHEKQQISPGRRAGTSN